MNLADPELELVDPTPNVHSLFIHFDAVFFWAKLAGKAVVRWSKKMYSSAGVCSYEGRGGICDIALSEPLLKLRPRQDLVQTLLHEMIHAFLFVVGKDQSRDGRDGHGPNFLSHMNRINQAAGINISVYHDFHDEVKLYQNHVWRCNGPCQKVRPYFGIVRRINNKVPGSSDYWWNSHTRLCGGTFVKIKEPAKVTKPVKQPKKKVSKTNANITKYINNNNETNKNKSTVGPVRKSINSFNDTKVTNKVEHPVSVTKHPVFTGSGKTIGSPRPNSMVAETVRNVWANKTLPPTSNAVTKLQPISSSQINNKKRISDVKNFTPPKKIKKIDDYFKTTASNILKDVYGKDFTVTQSNDKLKAAVVNTALVDCPICNAKVNVNLINAHIDECLNKDVIEKISKETIVEIKPSTSLQPDETTRKDTNKVINITDFIPTKINVIDKPIKTHNVIKSEIKEDNDFSILKESIDLTRIQIKVEPTIDNCIDVTNQPGTSKAIHTCPCCGKTIDKAVQEHLEECLIFDNDTIIPEGSLPDRTIVIEDSDDEFDETQTFNATGTKSPCPCCMAMVEAADMNDHLDICLGID